MAEASKGRKYPNRKKISDEARQRLSEVHKGNHNTLGTHHTVSDETRQKLSLALKGKGMGNDNAAGERDQETKDKMRLKKIGNKNASGHTVPDELRKKVSDSNKSRVVSKETREKLRQAMIGNKRGTRTKKEKEPLTEEQKEQKIIDAHTNRSNAQKGNQKGVGTHRTDEQKENIGAALKQAWDRRKQKGPTVASEETKQKLREAQKRRREKEKQVG